MNESERKLAAIQGLDPDIEKAGLTCMRCGCRDLRVVTTMQIDGEIRRYRQCRNCKKRMRTSETFG